MYYTASHSSNLHIISFSQCGSSSCLTWNPNTTHLKGRFSRRISLIATVESLRLLSPSTKLVHHFYDRTLFSAHSLTVKQLSQGGPHNSPQVHAPPQPRLYTSNLPPITAPSHNPSMAPGLLSHLCRITASSLRPTVKTNKSLARKALHHLSLSFLLAPNERKHISCRAFISTPHHHLSVDFRTTRPTNINPPHHTPPELWRKSPAPSYITKGYLYHCADFYDIFSFTLHGAL